jgi:hypothetical protein
MKPLHRFIAVQAITGTALGKFGVLAIFDLWTGQGFQTVGAYAAVVGLVNPFMMAASLRARMILVGDASTDADVAPMRRLLLVASVVGVLASVAVLIGTPYVVLGVLVAGTKLVENILAAQVGALQRLGLRDQGIRANLSRNSISLLVYVGMFAWHSLHLVVAVDLLVGLVLVLLLERSMVLPAAGMSRGYLSLLKDSAEFSIAAFLNAAVAMVMIRHLLASSHIETAHTIGLVTSMLSISGRTITENNLFYRRRIEPLLAELSSSRFAEISIAAVVLGVVALATAYGLKGNEHAHMYLGTLILILLIVNTYTLALRQSLMLQNHMRPVIILHVVECTLALMFFVPSADPFWTVLALVTSRVLRWMVFASQHRLPRSITI